MYRTQSVSCIILQILFEIEVMIMRQSIFLSKVTDEFWKYEYGIQCL
jgi:hypothetical protein